MRYFTSALIFAVIVSTSTCVAYMPANNADPPRNILTRFVRPFSRSKIVSTHKGRDLDAAGKETKIKQSLPLQRRTNGRIPTFQSRVVRKTSGLKTYTATITFAVTGRGALYHNGKKLKTVKNSKKSYTVRRVVAEGDIISFLTVSLQSPGGLIADVRYGQRHEVTSRSSSFRAQPAFPCKSWKTNHYSDCSWPGPRVVETKSLTRFAKKFPFSTGARYVWPGSSPPAATAYFRLIIGDSPCIMWKDGPKTRIQKRESARENHMEVGPKPKVVPNPKPKTKDTTKESPRKNGNHSKDYENGSSRCNCREAQSGWQGICHDFLAKKEWRLDETGACKARKCDTRFECVANDSSFTHRCIRKFAHQEVRPASAGPYSPPICMLAAVIPPRPFLVPYD